MKPLKPSHREKKRYLEITGKDLSKEKIDEAILDIIGILGYAKSSLHYVKVEKNRIILTVNRDNLNKIRTSLLLSYNNLKIVKVSGSLKKFSK